MIKALALFSGGLDSTLAAKIVLDQGILTEALHFVNAFLPGHTGGDQEDLAFTGQKRIAKQLGIKLHILDISQSHLQLVQKPRYGYGGNMNPCIDCRIFMFKEAKSFMENNDFSFLVSGEVLGQRPMSQRKPTLNIIDRDAHVQGLALRPLSAKLLRPTLCEEKAWVDRDKLFAFSGRSRKPQLALAKELGIEEYLTPAGGCLLTQIEFARKFRDLTALNQPDLDNVRLLKVGRHFRYNNHAKIIVGRNKEENECLSNLTKDGDILLAVRDFVGPLTIVRPQAECQGFSGPIEIAARLTVRYSKARDKEEVWVNYGSKDSEKSDSILVSPAEEDLIERLRI